MTTRQGTRASTSLAAALRTSLPSLTTLTPAERALMAEWLDRIPGC